MTTKSSKVFFNGIVESRSESKDLLLNSGDFVIIKRDVPRYMIILCPCGCGDELIVNLDSRSGPAWRLFEKLGFWTLYPSYWRESGCRSHFIIWNNNVYLFSKNHGIDEGWSVSEEIESRVLEMLKEDEFLHYVDLADECGLIPWECLQACKQLMEKRQCVANEDKVYFKKINQQME